MDRQTSSEIVRNRRKALEIVKNHKKSLKIQTNREKVEILFQDFLSRGPSAWVRDSWPKGPVWGLVLES